MFCVLIEYLVNYNNNNNNIRLYLCQHVFVKNNMYLIKRNEKKYFSDFYFYIILYITKYIIIYMMYPH